MPVKDWRHCCGNGPADVKGDVWNVFIRDFYRYVAMRPGRQTTGVGRQAGTTDDGRRTSGRDDRRQTTGVGRQAGTSDDRRRTTRRDVRRRTTDVKPGRQTSGVGRQAGTSDDRRRTTRRDVRRQTADDGRRTADDGRRTAGRDGRRRATGRRELIRPQANLQSRTR